MMIIVADAGSTKSEWVIINHSSEQIIEMNGLNPVLQKPKYIIETINKGFSDTIDVSSVRKVYYYGAGCTPGENAGRMQRCLKKVFFHAEIGVESDLLAAARALFFDKNGIACILGTGSNSGYYDGTKVIKLIPSLGYLLGDEGSGAYIGMNFLRDFFYKKVPEDLKNLFLKEFHADPEKLVPYIYSQKNKNVFFAKVAGFLTQNNHHEYVFFLIKKCFHDFYEAQIKPYLNLPGNNNVGFVGSIAYYNRHILSAMADELGLTIENILQKPLKNLIQYHKTFSI